MSIQNAMRLLTRASRENVLRDRIQSCRTLDEMEAALRAEDLFFTADEMESAHSHLMTQCQSEAAFDTLQQIRQWWDFCVYSVVTTDEAQQHLSGS